MLNIQESRFNFCLTREDLALELDIPVETLANWEEQGEDLVLTEEQFTHAINTFRRLKKKQLTPIQQKTFAEKYIDLGYDQILEKFKRRVCKNYGN